MQFSLKYIIALTAGLSLSPLHAEMVQSSSLTNDVEGVIGYQETTDAPP